MPKGFRSSVRAQPGVQWELQCSDDLAPGHLAPGQEGCRLRNNWCPTGHRTLGADALQPGLVSVRGSGLPQEQLTFKPRGVTAHTGLNWETHPDPKFLGAVLLFAGPEPAESRRRHRGVAREVEGTQQEQPSLQSTRAASGSFRVDHREGLSGLVKSFC